MANHVVRFEFTVSIVLILLISNICSQQITCNEFSSVPECNSPITCTANCQITCNTRGCTNKIINCNDDAQCEIHCTGQDGCKQAAINCPNNSGCDVQCNGAAGCITAQINGGSTANARLIVNCAGINSCKYTTFDARSASELTIQDCTWNGACIGITVYCPPNSNGGKKCTIAGDESMGGTSGDPITFYAVNGFDDITINSITENRYGTIYCHNLYASSCSIEQNPLQLDPPHNTLNAQWTCEEGGKCVDLTFSPIKSPTNHPITNIPTTSPPTTFQPTTNIPTTIMPTTKPPTQLIVCTKDTRICGDGTVLFRVPPSCQFESCPTSPPTTTIPTTSQPTTSNPTIVPTLDPTKEECADTFQAVISMSFGYVENDLTREQIDNIITNITNKFIHNEIQNKVIDCSLEYSNVDVIIEDTANEALVNISTCFDCDGGQLSISNDDVINELEKDFINLFNEETNILLIAEDSNVLITVIIHREPEGLYSDISTTLNYIKDKHLSHDGNEYTASIVIGVLILFLIICLCVIVAMFMYRAKHKEKQDDNIGHSNIPMVHKAVNSHSTYIQSNRTDINSNEIGEILDEDDTNSDGNMAVTAGGDNNTFIENEFVVESDEDNNMGTPAGNVNKSTPFAKIKSISFNMEGGRLSFIDNDEIIIGNDENNEFYTPKYNDEMIIDAQSDHYEGNVNNQNTEGLED